jgi:2'-5' RNA ligase
MRLFVAIDLTEEARAALAAVGRRIIERIDRRGSLRVVRPEQLHLTLVFIGEVDEPRAAAITESLRRPFDQAPFDLSFGGVGVFPGRGAPRVLWVGVVAGADGAMQLQRLVGERLQEVGIEPDSRPFSPHLTIGRWREGRPSDARRVLAEHVGVVARVHVKMTTLYQSVLSPHGSVYRPLAEAPLHGPAPGTGV